MKWYGVKLLYLEIKKSKYTAFRIEFLVKGLSPKQALDKAILLGKKIPHPHGLLNVKWEYVGPILIYECLTSPKKFGMLGFQECQGTTWKEALKYIRRESRFDINVFSMSEQPSPNKLYIAEITYFVQSKKSDNEGKILTCSCVVSSPSKSSALKNSLIQAVDNKTKRLVKKIWSKLNKSDVVNFVGIDNITPIYRKISDGMELDRTVQIYKNITAIRRLANDPKQLLSQKNWK